LQKRDQRRVADKNATEELMESAMNAPAGSSDEIPEKTSDRLHPLVHMAAAALLMWFVLTAWLLFGGAGYIDLALAIISVLMFMALAIPAALWRANVTMRRSNVAASASREADAAENEKTPERFDNWLRGQFATWTDREKATTATVEILLPLAAVAFGITALGIVFELTRAGVE
jgi:hypothetical protein